MGHKKYLPVSGLLTGAIVWGMIWQPYRSLEGAGISGPLASLLTYALPALVGTIVFRRHFAQFLRHAPIVVAIGLIAGYANLAYVLGTLRGEVMRVLLLFYLAPLWTVLFARLLLDERLGRAGLGVIALSVSGAAVMLWEPRTGIPYPRDLADWFGLTAGVAFALGNVLIRRAAEVTIELKTVAVFFGVMLLAALTLGGDSAGWGRAASISVSEAVLLAVLGVVLFAANLTVQYGLMNVVASRAIVVLLFELVVAALSAWLLAGEVMSAAEAAGGLLIVAATLLSGRLEGESARGRDR